MIITVSIFIIIIIIIIIIINIIIITVIIIAAVIVVTIKFRANSIIIRKNFIILEANLYFKITSFIE